MEVRCPLASEAAIVGITLFGRAEALKTEQKGKQIYMINKSLIDLMRFVWNSKCMYSLPFLHDCRIFAVIIGMHLHVAGADVNFIAFRLQAVIVRLLAVVLAFHIELNRTIVTGREP